MRMAVIGSGISGLAAAWLLSRKHEVVLFEQEGHAGGHTYTVQAPQGPAVDLGFIVYNERNYPHLSAMLRTLDIATGDSPMSFAVSIGGGDFEYAGDGNVLRMFAQRRNWLSARHHRMWIQILRLNRAVRGLLARDALPDVSLGDWLDRHGYGDELRSRYLLPMCAAIWSCSPREALAFPFPAFARFFDAHGLLQVIDGPKWRHVSGGSRRYAQRLLAEFSARGQLRLGTPVRAVRRTDAAAWVATHTGEERFDAVVSAAHADQALQLLADADEHERTLLSPFGAAANEAVLHTDVSLMPRRRGAWCAWNFLAPEEGVGAGPVCVSYWMNRLQALPGQVPYIVTLNPWRQPDPNKVLHRVRFEHPVFSRAAMAAQR
ncbi:MAG TPA: FAD-dependent oxidoreductase, partial [Candidatus Binatia bacterium]|nr:FAD-dependent oxidoreductase [Candidatus Binatia bacterium]